MNTLIIVSIYILVVILAIIVLVVSNIKQNKKIRRSISELEKEKNLILSAPILNELSKAESLVKDDKTKGKYEGWQNRFDYIRNNDIPEVTDMLINADTLIESKKFKDLKQVLADAEIRIYKLREKTDRLLGEIKEITLSEERNREIVTKLKTEYRQIYIQYNNSNKSEYSFIQNTLELQFENVDKLFSAFEIAMENNVYSEVGKIVKALDDTIGNLKVVIEEAPSIILMGEKMIPARIKDIKKQSSKLLDEGYNLDYLKIDYNTEESEKKVRDIFDRLKVLNLEDSIFELRTILDYFDRLYQDFEKEKIAKKLFDEYIRSVILKCKKLDKIISGLQSKIADIRYSYDLTDDDVKIIGELAKEIRTCEDNYNKTMDTFRNKGQAYSRLTKEMEHTNVRLVKAEEKLDYTLRSLGSLKEDEIRAREQEDAIKNIMKKTKEHLYSFKLPVIPKDFYTEYQEAGDALKEMLLELEKKPISIKVLNMRVDNARDLALKVYNTAFTTVKRASMAENAIVYGNRYRAVNKEINNGLTRAERLFFKGMFNESLTEAIKSINVVEPGIKDKLLDEYKEEYGIEE